MHWVTVKNRNFVCCTELLQKTKNCLLHWVTATSKIIICCQKKCQEWQQCSTFWHFWPILLLFRTFMPYFEFLRTFFVLFFWNFSVTYTNFVCPSDSVRQTKILFVEVAQCHKPKFSLSQWVSATNNKEKNIKFLCCM